MIRPWEIGLSRGEDLQPWEFWLTEFRKEFNFFIEIETNQLQELVW